MKLSIIIPAYNEESAIFEIVQRCIDAKDYICSHTSLTDIEIIVVDDGSRDHTFRISGEFKKLGKILLVSHEKNRGYGAAIKSGFEIASGEYVAFLDADGTCDPRYFVELFNKLEQNNADISIGSRMRPDSEMPKMRKLGNLFYAALISLMGTSKITDAASGMRILKKQSLEKIYPLPNGMNFTPAMSAKAVLDHRLKIVECFMPYKERTGESKLKVIRDGYRFLKTILEISLFYKPFKIFFFCALALFAISLFYGIPLLSFYFVNHRINETDIYRIVSIMVMGILGVNLLLLGLIADKIVSIFTEGPVFYHRIKNRLLENLLKPYYMAISGSVLIFFGVILNYKTIQEYLMFRTIHMHWSYVLVGAFLVLVGAEVIVYAFVQKLLLMYQEVLEFRKEWQKGQKQSEDKTPAIHE